MTSTLIFSRDRACQLDLLLRSVTSNASTIFDQIVVLWDATTPEFWDGYRHCIAEHENIQWENQRDFMAQTLDLLDEADRHHCFLTDDSVFYRNLDRAADPSTILSASDDLLCFSLRLGLHTGTCYSLRRMQGLPAFRAVDDVLVWSWRTGDADFGYMGSLDGHILRKDDLEDMLDGSKTFKNPNELEEILAKEVYGSPRPFAACHTYSHLVGVPVNRVNETHPNRYGDFHQSLPDALNDLYLSGKRIEIGSIKADRITAAHAEMEFHFYDT